MFVLAHLSDPHVASPLRLGWRDIAGKRLWGFFSWRFRRRYIHQLTILEAIADDLRAQRPDHVVVTGDITNISLPTEFPAAARWLARLGQPVDVSVIPGNHDAYVPVSWDRSWAHWGDHMRPDIASADDGAAAMRFPFVRQRQDVAIVGLSTAVVSGPGMALGHLGAEQIHAARMLLDSLRQAGAFRVVLLHHPPITAPNHRHKRLIDAAEFTAMLEETGAELVLHGHDHVHRLHTLSSQFGDIATVGAASASAAPVRGHAPAQYNLYRIARGNAGWTLDISIRRLDAGSHFSESQRHRLAVPRTHAPREPLPASMSAITDMAES